MVHSKEKEKYKREMRNVWIEKGALELEKLKERVKIGNLKEKEKIWYYLGKISRKYYIRRFFDFEIKGDSFVSNREGYLQSSEK